MKPVAWRSFDPKWKRWYLYQVKPADNAEPLYTAPRELSDDEIDEVYFSITHIKGYPPIYEFARAILKKASEK